jgi:tetratricopeptide (TPR) repeat protein
VLKYLLNESPNYHDARIFFARTFGWEGQYDSARNYLQQTKLRAPNHAELYVAWADIEYWSGNPEVSLELACEGLKHDSINNELLGRKARILLIKGNRGDAETITQKILKSDPSNEIANGILKKLNRI